ncbi:ABC transporter permease [Nonomuraea deserti]|uniref:ABC transporter permease n=1 Tax=Nonomuraea deserti TaxID=1848322 RepID=A0A4R4VJE0_9ACTN|nr:ABC transporter permease [Nonomuraea deserti]
MEHRSVMSPVNISRRKGASQRLDIGGYLPAVLLVVLVGLVVARDPAFLGVASLRSVAVQAAPILLLAVGLTPVILLGGIDLSVAALTSLCSVLLVSWANQAGITGVAGVVALATAAGAVVGVVHSVAQVPSFIVTLGALGLYSGLSLEASDATNTPLAEGSPAISWVNDYFAGIPAGFVFGLIVLAIVGLMVRFLPWGRYLYAMGSAEPAALMSGVPKIRVRAAAFALTGMTSAMAAIVLVGRTSFGSPTLASGLLLPAIAAVVVGGTAISGGVGGVGRTLVGVLTVTVVQIGMVVIGIDPVLQNVIFGAVIIVAVALTIDRAKLSVIK